jgi:hypothetical protein
MGFASEFSGHQRAKFQTQPGATTEKASLLFQCRGFVTPEEESDLQA